MPKGKKKRLSAAEKRTSIVNSIIKMRAELDDNIKYRLSIVGLDSGTNSGFAKLFVRPVEFRDLDQFTNNFKLKFETIKGQGKNFFHKQMYIERKLKKKLRVESPDSSRIETPNLVLLEDYSYGSQFSTFTMGEAGQTVRRLFYLLNIPVLLISPRQLKKWVKAEQKNEIMMNVLDMYGVKPKTSDEADAIILVKIGEALVNYVFSSYADEIVRNRNDDKEVLKLLKSNDLGELRLYQWEVLKKILETRVKDINYFRRYTITEEDDGEKSKVGKGVKEKDKKV